MRGSTGGVPDVIVVGGGVAGLAAATALAESGGRVLLLEARPYLGGRARSWLDPETGAVVDNGQHLMMGCYTETRRVLDRIGAADRIDWQERLEVPFVDRGGRHSAFRLPALVAPFDVLCGLLRFPGLSLGDRLSFLKVGYELRKLARRDRDQVMESLDGRTVAEWLASLGQSAEANQRLWHPLSIAALNESPERASAAMLLSVLRDGLFAGGTESRLGLAKVGLSELFADPAARYLRGRKCEVHTRAPVRRILVDGTRCTGVLMADGERHQAGAVVGAVTPDALPDLLPDGASAEPFFAGAAGLETSPIVSVYLWFGAPVCEMPFAGLIGGTWQWMFNRHALSAPGGGAHAITLVCSAARELIEQSRESLIRSAVEDLHLFFPETRRAPLRHSLVIKERRATIAHAPGTLSRRPASVTPIDRFHLAGDWIATGLPATIEGAALSGHNVARRLAAPA